MKKTVTVVSQEESHHNNHQFPSANQKRARRATNTMNLDNAGAHHSDLESNPQQTVETKTAKRIGKTKGKKKKKQKKRS